MRVHIIGAALSAALLVTPTAVAAAGLVNTRTNSLAIGDFDNDGLTDYAMGYPNWSVGKGKVVVVYGDEAIQVWNRNTPGVLLSDVNYNFFGDSVAIGDFDGDSYEDLAIGVPGDDHEGTNAGSVHILYGSASGLTGVGDQVIDQDSSGIANSSEAYDYFGEFLAAGDFNCSGRWDLAVGSPQEDMPAGPNTGAINVIYGTSGGLSSTDQWFTQNTNGVGGAYAAYEYFGASLLAANINDDSSSGWECHDLVVGVPGEGSVQYRGGAVNVFYGGTSYLSIHTDEYIHQNTLNVDDTVESNDQFATWVNEIDYNGDRYDDVVVRVPSEGCMLPAGSEGFHIFAGASQGLISTFGGVNDTVQCVYVDTAVQEIVDQYTTCLEEPGYCLCSEEFAFAVLNDTTISPNVQQPWMCAQKSKAVAQFCESVPTQTGPSLSFEANACIEAVQEAWQDCPGHEIEQG